MNFIYKSDGVIIYPGRHLIEIGNSQRRVRPKTFALLLLFLEKPTELLRKQDLLDHIWDDVTVDEQVLVQSISEIRRLFGRSTIIQTYPRKGYSWVSEVETHEYRDEEQLDGIKATSKNNAVLSQPILSLQHHLRKYRYFVTLLFLAIAFYVISNFIVDANLPGYPTTGVVIVLPIKNLITGNDHNWVPLGAMDHLIHSLISKDDIQVMEAEYVLNTMRHAHVPRFYKSDQVERIFDVSGASLIVESQLSGSVDDYHLEYKLRSKTDIKRGVIFDQTLNRVLGKLSQAIADQTGQTLKQTDDSAQNVFNNELMARAVEQLSIGELELAENLLKSLKQLEPNNLIAREFLVKILLKSKRFEQAKVEASAALQVAKASNSERSTKLYFLLAKTETKQGNYDDALLILKQAKLVAELNNDLLNQAYIGQERGYILQQQGDYELARLAYERALAFHGTIRCPVGVSLTHLQLVKMFSEQGEYNQAAEHFSKAKYLIETHQLDSLVSRLNSSELEKH